MTIGRNRLARAAGACRPAVLGLMFVYGWASTAAAVDLKQAVQAAVDGNPAISEAQARKRAAKEALSPATQVDST